MKKDWDLTFLQIAKLISEHSTCARVQVGAVLVKDRRIISCGYNGVPSGQLECKQHFADTAMGNPDASKYQDKYWLDVHREFSLKNELHGEQNAIGYAARNGIKTEGATMYLTISPCIQCAKLMIAAGIVKVIYAEKYNRAEDDGLPLLQQNNVECVLYV